MNTGGWDRSVRQPLWTLTRIVRSTRRPLHSLEVDAALLRSCASDQQGLLIDRCDCKRAFAMLNDAGKAMDSGVAWVIAATDRDQHLIARRAEQEECWIHDGHRCFRDASTWPNQGVRLLLTSVGELRAASQHNVRRRSDALGHFCPFIAVVDPELTLCERPCGGWDPAWVVRDVLSRLCAVQQTVAVMVFTARDLATISPSTVQKSYGLSGLLFLDLNARELGPLSDCPAAESP